MATVKGASSATTAGARPRIDRHRRERVGQRGGRRLDRGHHISRVLITVLEGRVVFVEHAGQSPLEAQEDVAHVAGVLQR